MMRKKKSAGYFGAPQEIPSGKRGEVLRSLEDYLGHLVGNVEPVEASWQPSDCLPDLSKKDWPLAVQDLQEAAAKTPDDLLVILIGNMITEEALPSYQTWFNRMQGVQDETGTDSTSWAEWSRKWTAQENRHGDILRGYLYLTGRVNMRAVEVTLHHLIRNGFNPHEQQDPYRGFVYTSFQETATRIAHTRVGNLAQQFGNPLLSKICSLIAREEAMHEKVYTSVMGKVFELDAEEAILALAAMLDGQLVMPGRLMDSPEGDGLFKRYSHVAQRLGVYTREDYAHIIQRLIKVWEVQTLRGLKGEALRAQEFVCSLPERYMKLAVRTQTRVQDDVPTGFAWIFDRPLVS